MNNEKNQPYQNDELLIGRNPVAEALSAGRAIIKVMVAKGNPSGAAVEITAKAKKAGIPVQEVERKKLDFMTGGAALVIGNEGKGISRLVREKCDVIVSLPMKGRINSLNASVAAGILMYKVAESR